MKYNKYTIKEEITPYKTYWVLYLNGSAIAMEESREEIIKIRDNLKKGFMK